MFALVTSVIRRCVCTSSLPFEKNSATPQFPVFDTSILFCSRLCPSTRVLQLSLAVLVHTAPCCPTMSSLQECFGLPADLTPFICHSLLLVVHLSFIRVMCPAPFPFNIGYVLDYVCHSGSLRDDGVMDSVLTVYAFSFPWFIGLLQVSLLMLL